MKYGSDEWHEAVGRLVALAASVRKLTLADISVRTERGRYVLVSISDLGCEMQELLERSLYDDPDTL